MEAITLSRQDASFRQHIEKQSGQSLASCYQCGNCTAGCPAGFTYDLQVSQIMRGIQLGLKDAVLNSRSLWMCLSCSTCSLRCPNNIDVAAIMEELRHEAQREGRITAKDVNAFWHSFLQTVRQFGRTYEIGVMALYMARTMRIFTDLDLAPAALTRQKLGLKPHITPNGGAKAVARIMQRYQERLKREGGA